MNTPPPPSSQPPRDKTRDIASPPIQKTHTGSATAKAHPEPVENPENSWGPQFRFVAACIAAYLFVRFCIYASGLIWIPAVVVCGVLWLCVSVRPNASQLHKWFALGTACLSLAPLAAYATASAFEMASNEFWFGSFSLGDTLLLSTGICAFVGAIAVCIWKFPVRWNRGNPHKSGSQSRWQAALDRFFHRDTFNRLNGDSMKPAGSAEYAVPQTPPQQPPPSRAPVRRVSPFTGKGRPPGFAKTELWTTSTPGAGAGSPQTPPQQRPLPPKSPRRVSVFTGTGRPPGFAKLSPDPPSE